MENQKDRGSLSPDAALVLETLETVSAGKALTFKVGKSPEHPRPIEAAFNELANGGHLETVSKEDLLSEYKFG